MTHIMPRYRIAITPTTEAALEALRYAFEGNMAHGEHQECSDDVLVAALLGWHLRKLGRQRDYWIKSLAYEFGMRVSMPGGGPQESSASASASCSSVGVAARATVSTRSRLSRPAASMAAA